MSTVLDGQTVQLMSYATKRRFDGRPRKNNGLKTDMEAIAAMNRTMPSMTQQESACHR